MVSSLPKTWVFPPFDQICGLWNQTKHIEVLVTPVEDVRESLHPSAPQSPYLWNGDILILTLYGHNQGLHIKYFKNNFQIPIPKKGRVFFYQELNKLELEKWLSG